MKTPIIIRLLSLALFTLPLMPALCQTPNFEWVKTFGGLGNDHGVEMVLDSNKYIITAGVFSQTVDFDPGPGVFNLTSTVNSGTLYITKMDTAGIFIWAKKIGNNLGIGINAMVNDAQGNLYITGYFSGTIDFDPGPGVYNMTTMNGVNSYFLKLDHNGNFIWAKQITATNSQTINVDVLNNVIISGQFYSTVDFDPGPGVFNASTPSAVIYDIYVLKLDSNGNFTWMKQLSTIGGGLNNAAAIRSDQSMNIYLTGAFGNTMDFDPGPGTVNLVSFGGFDIFVLKLDKDGNYTWVKQMGGPLDEGPSSLELDANGNSYTSGVFKGTADFDPGPGTFLLSTPGIYGNTYISKLDNNGNFIFAKQFTSSTSAVQASSITLDWSNNIYLTGSFGGFLGSVTDFDPGPAVFNLAKGDVFIAKLDSTGNFKWAGQLTDIMGSFAFYASAIKTDVLKNIYSVSSFFDVVDFDPGVPVFTASSNGALDVYVHKMSQCANTLSNVIATSCSAYTFNGVTYTSSGTYYQYLANSAGCDSIIILSLTISTTRTQINAAICQGQLYQNHSTSGIYIDTFINVSGCDSIRTLNLVVNSNPHPDLGKDSGICSGNSILLTPGNFNNYLWNDSSSRSTLAVTLPGIYWIRVKDNNNCIGSDTININQGTNPVIKAEKENDISCNLSSSRLKVTGGLTYQWSPATGLDNIYSQAPLASPSITTKYFVTGRSGNGCESKDSVTVLVEFAGAGNFFMPNSFTPNNDGRNDCYGIKYSGHIQDLIFMIYDRWGEKIFSTNNPSTCWDGKYKGQPADPGGYVYYIKAYTNCGIIERKGNLLLIR